MKRALIGPPHAHLDAPCTDDCYMYEGKPSQLTDGHHTMEELYDHQRALTAVLAAYAAHPGGTGADPASWRSKAHHPDDGPMFEGGYFIVGIELDTGTITYHYKLTHWDDFAAVPELEHAPKWDRATPADTVTRLLKLAAFMAQGPFGSAGPCDTVLRLLAWARDEPPVALPAPEAPRTVVTQIGDDPSRTRTDTWS
jgi:hypothetical protein